jgi:hypothetical protein
MTDTYFVLGQVLTKIMLDHDSNKSTMPVNIDKALVEDAVVANDEGRALSKVFSHGFEHAIEQEEEQLAMENAIKEAEMAEAEALSELASNAEARKLAKEQAAIELAKNPEPTPGAKWRAIRPNSKTKRRKAKRRKGGKYKV